MTIRISKGKIIVIGFSLKDFCRYIKVTPGQAAYQIEKIWKERELMAAM